MPFVRAGRPGLLGTMARTAVVAGTASATVNAVNRHSQARAQQQQDAAAYQAQQQAAAQQAAAQYAAPQAPPAPAGDDVVTKLTELAKLRESGVLSPAEFDAAKAKLLGT